MSNKGAFNNENSYFNNSLVGPARLREELTWLKQRFSVTDDDLLAALTPVEDDAVPLSIFVPELGVLEALAHLGELVVHRGLDALALAV